MQSVLKFRKFNCGIVNTAASLVRYILHKFTGTGVLASQCVDTQGLRAFTEYTKYLLLYSFSLSHSETFVTVNTVCHSPQLTTYIDWDRSVTSLSNRPSNTLKRPKYRSFRSNMYIFFLEMHNALTNKYTCIYYLYYIFFWKCTMRSRINTLVYIIYSIFCLEMHNALTNKYTFIYYL